MQSQQCQKQEWKACFWRKLFEVLLSMFLSTWKRPVQDLDCYLARLALHLIVLIV
jgi:hypothetical protein